MYIAENLTLLRTYWKLSLEEVASMVGLTRQSMAGYEKGKAVPPVDVAGHIASVYKVSLDVLMYHNLSGLTSKQFQQIMSAPDPTYRGRTLQVREVVHSISPDNKELIELVPVRAAMGYAQGGFENGEFIAELPKFSLPLPNISPDRLYRLFPTSGDSMLPIAGGSYILGEYVEDWYSIKSGLGCVFILRTDGIVFKKAVNEMALNNRFELHSLNPTYKPYYVSAQDIREIWKFTMVFSDLFPDTDVSYNQLVSDLHTLKSGQDELLRRLQ